MPESYYVVLSRNVTPVFPQRCIVSNEYNPDSKIRVYTHSVGWWSYLCIFGKLCRFDVPVKKAHRYKFLLQRWGGFLILGLSWIACFIFLNPYLYSMGSYRKPILFGALILSVIPFFIWQQVYTPYFSACVRSDTIEYEFKNEEYAMDFAELNNEQVIKA